MGDISEAMETLNNPFAFCSSLAQKLYDEGVRDIISCPGGRSAEILNAFVDCEKFNIESFYDERSAGFYALGKSLKTNKPVVVLTTSGSAVAGLYPAALEAVYQQNAKLILLTADRPLDFRNTGAPQTINQKNFFKENKIETVDVQKIADIKSLNKTVHLNVCLPDPVFLNDENCKIETNSPLVLISSLRENEKAKVLEAFKSYEGVLILESLSNFKSSDFPEATVISFPDLLFSKVSLKSFNEIYRIGGVPVSKLWRSIQNVKSFYWDEYEFSGGIDVLPLSLKDISDRVCGFKPSGTLKSKFEEKLLEFEKSVSRLVLENAESEVGQIEWEFVNSGRFTNYGQRGVNGIDGTLALFLGQLSDQVENWIIIGDLTCLYNINDFQALTKIKNHKVRIVVVNNSGGQIFNRIFKKNLPYFINSQNVSFEDLAKMWGMGYTKAFEENLLPLKVLIELSIDNNKSKKILDAFSGLSF